MEAKQLVDALDAASRKKPLDVLTALGPFEGLVHADFVKPFVKLLVHPDDEIALVAARLLERQKPTGPDEKRAAKELDRVVKDVWKSAYAHPTNARRSAVRAAIVKVMGAWGVVLDAKPCDDAKALWAGELRAPDPRKASTLLALVAYVEATKDKRFCRLLAEVLDHPTPENVKDGTNPPADYWEARWHLQEAVRGPALGALKTLTGQTFLTTAEAQAWFKANEKTFGFSW